MVIHTKEQQPAFQRWEMTSFGDERPSVAQREAANATPSGRRSKPSSACRRLAPQQEQLEMGPPLAATAAAVVLEPSEGAPGRL
jgi:flagellar assembly protein FliH